jgi:hypothetical protein
MALIDKKAQADRIPIPHEEGAWVEIAPLTFGDKRRLAGFKGPDAVAFLISAMVVGWSYDSALTPEGIDSLDGTTGDWLVTLVSERALGNPKGERSIAP